MHCGELYSSLSHQLLISLSGIGHYRVTLMLILMAVSLGHCVKRTHDFGQWSRAGQVDEGSSRQSKMRSSIGHNLVPDQFPGLSYCECGKENRARQTRVVGGVETIPHVYPWMAFVRKKVGEKKFRHAATILTAYHLLSAAHATYGIPKENITVMVGIHNVSNPDALVTQKLTIANYTLFPNFINNMPFYNDISILVTEDEIKFTPNVGPICLPSSFVSLERQQFKAMGWGVTKGTGDKNVLREVDLAFVPYKECRKSRNATIVHSQLCTFGVGKNLCQGDSGGGVFIRNPLEQRYTQVGVVSFGVVDCLSKPSISTDLRFYYTWIGRTIAENKPGLTACLGA